MNTYIEKLNWRYATKKFDPTKKLGVEQIEMLTEALRLAPSSFGLQPWKFYIVENPGLRSEIQKAAWNQSQITDASHLFVLAAKKNVNAEDVSAYIKYTAEVNGAPAENFAEFEKMINNFISQMGAEARDAWTAKQVYIALGFLLSAAAENQIDACPMEGFDSVVVSELLGTTKDGYAVCVMCPVGFRSPEDTHMNNPKIRFKKERVFENK